jgi:7,8-dihydropterin-6-yl-methyl-4-(beta-D-ribofuranosyl)aminobenzene 5'-phosphate synthase
MGSESSGRAGGSSDGGSGTTVYYRAMRFAFFTLLAAALAAPAQVRDLRIQVLSTMLTGTAGVGEWGFAALVEVDGKRILFDTGARPQTVLANTREMKIDLTGINDVILSHNHGDHTSGLLELRRAYPKALGVAHAGRGIFYKRSAEGFTGSMAGIQKAYEAGGGRFVEYAKPAEIQPGVWLTGPVPRRYPERNWSGSGKVETPEGTVEDNVPEDMSMVFRTAKGLVVLSGCGHAGIVNTLEYARATVGQQPIHAAVGGFHLFNLDDEKLAWTAGKLREFGLGNFLGAHCTGIEATYRIRQLTGLGRTTAAVGAVGSTFDLKDGLRPGAIAR